MRFTIQLFSLRIINHILYHVLVILSIYFFDFSLTSFIKISVVFLLVILSGFNHVEIGQTTKRSLRSSPWKKVSF